MKLAGRNLVLATMLSLSFSFSASATEFANGKSYPVGTSPSVIAVGDFNGDGKPDIAVLNSGSNNVSILLNNGDGTFQAAKNFDAGGSFTKIAVADFNGDGRSDLALFQPGDGNAASGTVAILLGNADGTLQAPKATTLTPSAFSIAVGDFTGDKKADLIVSNTASGGSVSLQLAIGKGDGAFQASVPVTVPVGLTNVNVLVADFNNDGKLDLAVVTAIGVQVLVGKGDGTFQPGGTAIIQSGFTVNSFVVGDLNGDGKMDLVVDSRMSQNCGTFCGNTSQRVSAFFGQGNGSFGSEILFYTGAARRQIEVISNTLINDLVVADFNADGKADVGDQAGSFEIRLSNGDGSFTPAIAFQNSGGGAVAADLNGDKLADLVVPEPANNDVLVFVNDSPTSGADLGIISSSVSGDPGVGLNLTYSAGLLNEGPQDATNVLFTDTLPAGVTFVAATSTLGTCTQSNGTVTCNVGLLANRSGAQVSITVTPTATGSITNSMSVAATQADLAPANNSASQTTTILPVFTLTVIKQGTGSGTVNALGGINCGNTCSAQYVSGKRVIFVKLADADSTFEGWGGACSGNTACAVTMTADMTVTATFTLKAILSVNFAGAGSGMVAATDGSLSCSNTQANCSATYAPGSSVSLTATPTGNSIFSAWGGACTGTDPMQCSVTLNANAAVTATFAVPPDFKFNPASTSLTVPRGQRTTDVLAISEQGGFSSAIQLSCSVTGPSPTPGCSLSPSSIPAGANSASSTLTLDASGLAATRAAMPAGPERIFASLLPFALLGCLFAGGFEKRTRQQIAVLALFAALLLTAACGGGGAAQPQAQNFTVTVTGAGGGLQHSTVIPVIVQ